MWCEILERLHQGKNLCSTVRIYGLLFVNAGDVVEEGFLFNIIQSLPKRLHSIVETDGEWVIVRHCTFIVDNKLNVGKN